MNEDFALKLIKEKNVKALCKAKFDLNLTPTQESIVRKIAFREHKRISISATTRYGKTQCVAAGIALGLQLHKVKVAFIGPQKEQASILRQYLADLILKDPELRAIAEINSTGVERIGKEANKSRMTFSNGSEYRVFSAEGDANRLMGFGADIVVKDESVLISNQAHAKIMRMLGDNPESGMLIELFNPWNRDGVTFEHTQDPAWEVIHVDYKTAIEEGRTTLEFVEEQRKEITPLEFTVLYESRFPDESDDSVFNLAYIRAAINREIPSEVDVTEKILGCDVADKGRDRTVIYNARQRNDFYEVYDVYSEDKSENTAVAGRLVHFQEERGITLMNIDSIGVGVGVVSMVKERSVNTLTKVVGCHFGEKAFDKKFLNRKAEAYFKLKWLFQEGLIKIPDDPRIVKDLLSMRWEFTSNGKIKIIDPEDRSPDFSDALVYTVWSSPARTYAIG